MNDKYYVTSSIVYVNAEPHIGYAMELVAADVVARYHRGLGAATYYLTGTDEHGQKLFNAAGEAGQDPQAFVDAMNRHYQQLTKTLNLSNDGFVRTTSPHHKAAAQKLWQACSRDIYKGTYEGWYCVRCERFYNERETEAGKCPIHHIALEWSSIESYFFRQSAYARQIRQLIESNQLRIFPAKRKNEILAYIGHGLEDISISRPKNQLEWGVEVPGDPDHVMYVWFDALTNYISGVGYAENPAEFTKWWPADLHVIGKDISRFHCVMWPAMLLSAGITPPKAVYIHGFITDEHGEKISKSLGNTTDPNEIISSYGVDALRYYLLRYIPHDDDGVFTMNLFARAYNADLANDLGNLVSRVANMLNRYCGGRFDLQTGLTAEKPTARLENCEFDLVLAGLFERVSAMNKTVEDEKPWVRYAAGETAKVAAVLSRLASELVWLADQLQPFMPDTAARMHEIFKADGSVASNPPILFPKHDAGPNSNDAG